MMKKINEWIDGVSGFIGGVFSEPNGKASFSRVFAAYVIYQIVSMAETGAAVSGEMMTVFWVLMGTQTVSKFTPAMKIPGLPTETASVVATEVKTSSVVTQSPAT